MNVSTRRVRSDEQGIDVVRLMCGSKHVLTKISSLSPNLSWKNRLGKCSSKLMERKDTKWEEQ
jgi:hypothetical protein